jgi:hypothetical protein
MDRPRKLAYTPHPDATPEDEAAALAAVYAYLLRCEREKKGAAPESPPKMPTISER